MELIAKPKAVISPTVDVDDCIVMAKVICNGRRCGTACLVPQRTKVVLHPVPGVMGAFDGRKA